MIAVIFPGQGSQKPGMGQDLAQHSAEAKQVFAQVNQATGLDIEALAFNSDEETLRQTQNAQIALFTAGLAAYQALRTRGIEGDVFAGHSIGEYAALVASGAIDLATGAKLVQRRGELMAESGKTAPGSMAAVLGLDRAQIEPVLAEIDDVVVIANDNCPGQIVISGSVSGVAAAGPKLQEAGAKRVLPLNVSGAFHSPLMEGPSKLMGDTLATVTFNSGRPVYSNVTTLPVANPADWNRLLEEQLRSSVRWTESVQNMIAAGVDTFIECGSGEVLSGLLKRIDKSVRSFVVQDTASLEATVAALK